MATILYGGQGKMFEKPTLAIAHSPTSAAISSNKN